MAASLLGLSLALGAGRALAQTPGSAPAWDRNWPPAPPASTVLPPPPSLPASNGDPGSTLTFHRDAVAPTSPSAPSPLPPLMGAQDDTLTFHRAALQTSGPSIPSASPPLVGEPGNLLTFQRDAAGPKTSAPAVLPGPASIQMGGGQKMEKTYPKTSYEAMEFRSLRELPGLEVVTRLESEDALKQRMRQELLRTGEKIIFPEEPVVTKEPYQPRHEQPLVAIVEPNFVCHDRLLFEQQNFERGMWDLGILGPVVSVGEFCVDIAMLPYHLGTRPFQQYDCSAGKCLPGDPSPFMLHPPELSLSGLTVEAAAITGLFFVFP